MSSTEISSTVLLEGGEILPSWLPSSREEFRELVVELVAVWIVGGILDVIGAIGRAILTVGDELLGVGGSVGGVILTPFRALGSGLLAVANGLDAFLVTVTGALGPFAPLGFAVSVGIVIVLGFLSARILIEVVRFI